MKQLDTAKGAVPLYAQIYSLLKKDIERGIYGEGDSIPTEMELQERYGVSRITVRQAILALEQEGAVIRIRGKGTIVSHKPKFKETLSRIRSFTNEMLDHGMVPGSREVNVELVPAGKELAEIFSCSETEELYHITRVRTGDGKPIVRLETWLSLNVRLPLDAKAYEGSVYALLEQSGSAAPWAVEDQFEAVIADETVCKALDLPKGAPVMKRTRTGFDRKMNAQEYTIGYYDSQNYNYIVFLQNAD